MDDRPSADETLTVEPTVHGFSRSMHARLRSGVHRVGAIGRRMSLPGLYLTVAIVWGLALVVLVPPFQVADENAHFYHAWGIAEGHVLGGADYYVPVPKNVAAMEDEFPVWQLAKRIGGKSFSPSKTWHLLGERISTQRVNVVAAVPSTSPVAYVPQALAIRIAMLVGHSPVGALYLARLLNLLASVALVFYAIRLVPYGKSVMVLAALFPVSLSQMASASPDGLAIGGVFFFTALVLHYACRPVVTTRAMFAVAASAVVLLTAKPGYFGMAGLVLLISPSQFKRPKWSFWAWAAGIAVCVVCLAALEVRLMPSTSPGFALSRGLPANIDSNAQIGHVLGHPIEFLTVVLHQFSVSGIHYGYQMVAALSWLTLPLSNIVAIIVLLAAVLLLGGLRDETQPEPIHRFILAATWVVVTLSVCAAIYVGLNPVGANSLSGLQGRYFTPALPLLLLALYRVRLKKKSAVIGLLVMTLIIVAVWTLKTILSYYY
jgi:uncharacterized membrane protein